MSLFGTLGKIVGGVGGFLLGGPAVAAAGAGLLGGVGSAIDGNKQTKATTNATTQAVGQVNQGYQSAINAGNAQYNQTAGNLAPWLISGQLANAQQGNLVGLNGGAQQQAAIDALKASPMYSSLFNNGQNAILANASATGGLRGGNTQRSLYGLGNDTLAQLIQSQLGNLGGISALGANTATGLGALGAANTSSIQGLLGSIGANNAAGTLTNAGLNAANNTNNSSILDGLFSQGGAGSSILSGFFNRSDNSNAAWVPLGERGFTSNDMGGWLDGAF